MTIHAKTLYINVCVVVRYTNTCDQTSYDIKQILKCLPLKLIL